jgi:general secretion pathway protein L
MYYKQYLAIDYGTSQIKGVLFRQFLGSVTILRYETLEIVKLKEKEEDEYEYNIVRFIQSFFPEESNFIINIPMDNLFIRDIVVPMVKKEAIRAILPAEVENVVPFPIESMVVQSTIWRIGKEVSNIVTFSAHHSEIENTFKPFMKGEIQIDCISNDASSLSAIIRYHQTKNLTEKVVGQLDIGGRLCIFNVNQSGYLSHSRFFSGGGFYITNKISKLMNLEYSKAEELKFEFTKMTSNQTEEQILEFIKIHHITKEQFNQIIKIIEDEFTRLTEEIIKSIYALSPENRPSIIYISGGSSLFLDMDKFLSKIINIPVKRYDFLELPDSSYVTALGLGYHFRLEKSERVDFLTSEFSKLLKNSFKLDAFTPHLLFTSISLFILVAVFLTQMILDSRKLNSLQESIDEKFKLGFPGINLNEDDDAMSKARELLNNEQKRSEIVTKFLNKENVLELVLELNQMFPNKEEFNFSLERFILDETNKIFITGRVDEYHHLGQLESSLQKSPKFKNIKIVSRNQIFNATNLKIQFKMEMEVVNSKDKKEGPNAE